LPWIEEKVYEDERLPASYANFLIINGAVLVPTYNDKNDNQALEVLQKAFKNRDVIGIDCSKVIRQHGSLHCLTMQYY
jgi:agmatine deiminase